MRNLDIFFAMNRWTWPFFIGFVGDLRFIQSSKQDGRDVHDLDVGQNGRPRGPQMLV